MQFVPNYELKLLDEANFETEIAKSEELLQQYKNSGSFTAFDGIQIYYEYFLCENASANAVLVHGLSEFSQKYHEQIYYLLNQGYNVFTFDLRGHGLSDRLTNQIDLLHVGKFDDYVKDLSQFIETVVIPIGDKPIYLLSHSIGGAISALYLAENGEKVQKAVMSAPCFDPVVKAVPKPVAWVFVGLNKWLKGPKKKFAFSSEFNPDVKYNIHHGSSKPRFLYNMKMRCQNPRYQTTPMSYGWVSNAFKLRSRIVKDSFIKKIKTPILLITAQNDGTVRNDAQIEFAQKCNNCKMIELEGVTHAVFATDNDTMRKMLECVYDYLG